MVAPPMDRPPGQRGRREQSARSDQAVRAGMRRAESSLLVSAYRRALPHSARRALAVRFTPEFRSSVKRGLATSQLLTERYADWQVLRADRRIPPAFSAREVCRAVLVGQHVRLALARAFPSPLQAHTDTLAAVTESLEAAGIRYVCIRGGRHSSSALAVSEDDRGRVLRALRRLSRTSPAYLSLPPGTARRRGRRAVEPGSADSAWRHVAGDPVIRLHWYYTDLRGTAALGLEYGCEIEFWQPADDRLRAPRRNPVTDEISATATPVEVPLAHLTRWAPREVPRLMVRTLPEFGNRHPADVTFPVDVVYTWVDGADPEWRRRRAAAGGAGYHPEAANAARYLNRDELRYSLRSLHQFAPWVRTVHLVTDDQVPRWLNTAHPRIRVVSHREIFSDPGLLPTFNSHAIESQLHHIDGLAEHFVYLNDDVFLGRLLSPQAFFLSNGLTRFFLSKAHIPQGGPTVEDVPVSVAGKNNRAVLAERFGTVVTQKFKHVPHALRRSVLYEIEQEFAPRHRATAANRFRSLDDLSVTSSLHHYYAYLTGRAVPGDIRYDYFDLSHENTPARLGRLLRTRNRETFCVNDTVSADADADAGTGLRPDVVTPFLEGYFPLTSPFELTGSPD